MFSSVIIGSEIEIILMEELMAVMTGAVIREKLFRAVKTVVKVAFRVQFGRGEPPVTVVTHATGALLLNKNPFIRITG